MVRLRPDVRLANDADLSVPSAVALSGMSTLMWSTILTPFFKNAPRPCWVDLGGIAAELMNARVGRKCGTHAARKAMRDARTVNRDPMHAMRRGETVAVLNGIITILKVFFWQLQVAQNAELSINESAQNLQTVYTTIRPQSLPAIVNYDASSNRTDNLMFLGGHGDHALADSDASYNQTAKVKSMQFSYDTMLFPQKRLETSARDAKAALVHAVGSLDLWDGEAFVGSLDPSGKGYWDNSGVFAIVQNFKTSRDDYVNGLNSAATGAPLMLSLQLAKPAQVPLRVESFCKNDYTLNVTKMGQATVLNGSARESPVD